MQRSTSFSIIQDSSIRAVLIFIVLVVARIYIIYTSPIVLSSFSRHSTTILAQRDLVVSHLADLIARGDQHLYVSGSAGTGKSESIRRALDSISKSDFQSSYPAFCYIDLLPLLAIAPTKLEQAQMKAIKDKLISKVAMYDFTLMRELRATSTAKWLAAFLTRYWPALLTFTNFQNPQAFSTFPHSEYSTRDDGKFSVSSILNHVVSTSEQLKRLVGGGYVPFPVLVLDGWQALSAPHLAALNDEMIAFLGEHLPLKAYSQVRVILLSSENLTGNPQLHALTQGLAAASSGPMLHQEVIGDLTTAQTREYLYALSNAEWANTPDSNAQLNRLSRRIANDTEYDLLYSRIGGFLPDILRFAHTQLASQQEEIIITDRSRVHYLEKSLDVALGAYGIDPSNLLVLYRAMLEKGKSPRAALLIAEVIDTLGVPEAFLLRLVSLGLLEIREKNPTVLDYSALRGFLEPYICSPSPLARYSMAKIVKRLEKTVVLSTTGHATSIPVKVFEKSRKPSADEL